MRMYFTFGSDERFPYGRDDYVVAEGRDMAECLAAFKLAFPNRTQGVLNCASYYTEKQWSTQVAPYYVGRSPAQILSVLSVSETFHAAIRSMKQYENEIGNPCGIMVWRHEGTEIYYLECEGELYSDQLSEDEAGNLILALIKGMRMADRRNEERE